ncbi:MAG: hypothetical protein CL424_00300 [Acidimicrobiaceae bacterium]|nr:hypothetical protein [Acidimicrobiaceae bacterium]
MTDLDTYWRDLVTAAMLGTDRRDPPVPPDGPIADLVDDALRPDPGSRMLATVAAVAAARRAAFVPGPSADTLQPPEADDRPMCSPSAAATWRQIVSEWSVLEDEWMLAVIERGLRLSPDVLVEALARHRSDGVRRARVMLAGGAVARWLVGHVPELSATSSRRVAAAAVGELPALPMPPELDQLRSLDAHTVARRLAGGFEDGRFGGPDRAVLVNLVARCRPAVLVEVAAALQGTGVGHALALADLARLRHRMLTELE